MPKIINNLKKQLMDEARKQIEENGYAATTIRSVAKACDIAVGTVYNYFPSKDMLIASFVLEDWLETLRNTKEKITLVDTRKGKIQCIYNGLKDFARSNERLFTDSDAKSSYTAFISDKHSCLRERIAELICPEKSKAFLYEYIAESIITWTMAGTDFETLYSVIEKLL